MTPTEKPKILIVDDQPRNLDVLEAMLGDTDCALIRATSAEEALLCLVRNEFAALVLDIKMPGMSGIELATLVKQRKRSQHVPILFLTAHSVDEALRVLDQKPVVVVVTDLAMPGADGFAMVRRLREEGPPHARALPVIAVSAYARGADRERVLADGSQGDLGKPLEIEQLTAMIAHVSGRAVS